MLVEVGGGWGDEPSQFVSLEKCSATLSLAIALRKTFNESTEHSINGLKIRVVCVTFPLAFFATLRCILR